MAEQVTKGILPGLLGDYSKDPGIQAATEQAFADAGQIGNANAQSEGGAPIRHETPTGAGLRGIRMPASSTVSRVSRFGADDVTSGQPDLRRLRLSRGEVLPSGFGSGLKELRV